MEITRPDQIDGATARQLRLAAGKTQPEFWGCLGISKAQASGYETGRYKVPETAKLLIYLVHVCKFPLGHPHELMMQIGAAMNIAGSGLEKMKRATAIAEAAIDHLKSAQKCMEED